MCGITGILHARSDVKRDNLQESIEKMALRLFHRGPDDAGTYVDEASGLALGFRRLAILDLSADGHQPMRSRGGRFTMVFNGEIYNYLQLAEELKQGRGDAIFRGHSDTEVMLEAIERWGLEAAVKRFQGMFAFALWDAEWSTLHLVRDRMGEKPLYYGQFGDTFLFGSELKALRAHPAFRGAVDQESVLPFLAYGYIPGSRSIYERVSKVLPGSVLRVRPSTGGFDVASSAYWTARSAGEQTTGGAQDRSAAEQAETLDRLLREVIAQQMISDVPLGAFLSGGIDSSTVVGIMQSLSPRPIKTFTVGFEEDRFSEAKHAKAVADHLGTAHTELTVTAADAFDLIPRLPAIYDEPFADSSQIPTLLVSKLARTQVTVSLSGDGADELFGGYDRYRRAIDLWQRLQKVNRTARLPLGRALANVPWTERPSATNVIEMGQLMSRSSNPDAFYETFAATDRHVNRTLAGNRRRPVGFGAARPSSPDLLRRFMQTDMMSYLPDDILVKVDRASMAYSLESRAPFLDVRIVEFAAGLPSSMLVRGDQGKWLLRQVLHKYVPRELVERPKMGFGIPLADWLRGPLRGWAEELLSEEALTSSGLFDARHVRRVWSELLARRHTWEYRIWSILMLQAWLEAQRTA